MISVCARLVNIVITFTVRLVRISRLSIIIILLVSIGLLHVSWNILVYFFQWFNLVCFEWLVVWCIIQINRLIRLSFKIRPLRGCMYVLRFNSNYLKTHFRTKLFRIGNNKKAIISQLFDFLYLKRVSKWNLKFIKWLKNCWPNSNIPKCNLNFQKAFWHFYYIFFHRLTN